MKRILAIAITLIMVLTVLTGCMSQQISSGPEEDQNPPGKEQGTPSLNPPVPGEIIDLKINSLDKLNYFAELRMITGTPTVSKQSMTGGSFEIVFLANGSGQDKEEFPPAPDTTGSDVTEGPSVAPENPENTDSDEDFYYYELAPNEPYNPVLYESINILQHDNGEWEIVVTTDEADQNGQVMYSILSAGLLFLHVINLAVCVIWYIVKTKKRKTA